MGIEPEESKVVSAADSLLLEQWSQGDTVAFEQLFVRHYPRVFRVLCRLLGSADEAEDVAQEVFLKLHRRPLSPRSDSNLAAWLYRVATRMGYNALRSRKRRAQRESAWDKARQDGSTSHPEADVLRSETQAEVREALAELPLRQAQMVFLRYQGFSYEELAQIVGVKPSSVGTLLVRAERAFAARYAAQRHAKGGVEDA